eukprot:scaffold691_cov17-Prasinocladus_malaysianus.AAC.1
MSSRVSTIFRRPGEIGHVTEIQVIVVELEVELLSRPRLTLVLETRHFKTTSSSVGQCSKLERASMRDC